MKHIQTDITIATDSKTAWKVLTNFQDYPNWNPFIKSISGEVKKGAKLEIEIKPPNRKPMTFKPTLLRVDSEKELRWLGSGPVKGLFDGQHYFKIIEQEDDTIKFEHGEIFTGILVGLMPKLLVDTKLGFEQMNNAFKEVCESKK